MEKITITLSLSIETNASLSEIHNAISIGVNDAFPDNGITDNYVVIDLIDAKHD